MCSQSDDPTQHAAVIPQATDATLLRLAGDVVHQTFANGGGTYEGATLLPFTPKGGFAVGIGGINFPDTALTPEAIAWLARRVSGEHGTVYIGTWLDGGRVYIDAVEYYGADRMLAARARGVERGQIAIYDFEMGRPVML